MRLRLRNLIIPDFPLGALLALGLFGVGFVFAFPDDSYVWLWELVIAIAALLWAIGAGLFAAILPDNVKKTPESDKESAGSPNNEEKRGLSSSFSALVAAINAHSRANIAEESKEDYERALRERITIVLLVITMIAIIFQVIEMKRVYEPIREQAETTKNNMITDHRAWISVTQATIDPLSENKPVSAKVSYANTGRQPAPLNIAVFIHVFTSDEWSNGKAGAVINEWRNNCFSVKNNVIAASMVAPTSGANFYTYNVTSNDSIADSDMIAAHKIVAVLGCFLYRTFDEIRHTSFCGSDIAGGVVTTVLNFCTVGNDVD